MAVEWPGNTRNWAPEVRKVASELERRFDVRAYTYPNHGRTGERFGIDLPVAPLGQRANAEQEALGDEIQRYVERHQQRLGVCYMIWWNWMIEYGRDCALISGGEGGRWFSYEPYAFEWPFGSAAPNTRRHLDHPHLQIRTGHVYRPASPANGPEPEDRDKALKDAINRHFASLDPPVAPPVAYEPRALAIVEETRRALIPVRYPVSLVCAVVEQESWGRNIFGCDWGERWTGVPPYCQVEVTEQRVKRLIRNFERQNGVGANGIGLPQLTTPSLVYRAEALGGAHIPRNQLRVASEHLSELIRLYGYEGGIGAYNAGPAGRWSVRWTYTESVIRKHNEWIERLT